VRKGARGCISYKGRNFPLDKLIPTHHKVRKEEGLKNPTT
jgi:hypothetical protein